MLLLLLALAFSIPAVQTKVAHNLTEKLNTEFGTDIHIDKVRITYNFKIDLKGVYLGDHHNDTLITAESLKTSLINIPGILDKNINFGNVTAKHLTFRLRRYKEDEKDSFGLFLDKLESDNPDEAPTKVIFNHLNILDSKFSFVDEHSKYPNIVNLRDLNIDASDFIIDGGDISVNINKLSGIDKRGVEVKDFSVDFKLRDNSMTGDNFDLITSESSIKGSFHFFFNHTMQDFENQVKIDGNFEKASISTSDLNKYYTKFEDGHQLDFHGRMLGTLNDFQLKDFHLTGMKNTSLDGDMSIINLLDEGEFVFGGDFENLRSNYSDLVHLLPGVLQNTLPKEINELGNIHLTGKVNATKRKVVTNSMIHSDLGNAKLDVTLTNLSNGGSESYDGRIKFQNLDLGYLLKNKNFGRASFTFNMKGKGFQRQNLNSDLDGVFSSLVYNNYTYHNIEVIGELKNPVFTGKVFSHDPNLKMNFEGMVNVSSKDNDYDLTAEIEYADLHKLNFVKNDSISIFKGNVAVNLEGHNLDDIEGNIGLTDVSYQNREGVYNFDKLNLDSYFTGDERTITVNSPDIIDGKMEGHFIIKQIPDLFKNAVGNLYSNYQPIKIAKNQYVSFDISIHNKIIQAIFPNISLKPETFIKGRIKSEYSGVKLIFKSPEIKIYDNTFKNVNLQLDNANPLFTTYFDVDSVSTKYYDFSKVHMISNRINDTLFVRSQFKGGQHNNDEFNINFFHTINKENNSVIGVRRSNLKFKESTWLLNRSNEDQTIAFSNDLKDFDIEKLIISHNKENIKLSGVKKGSDYKDFHLMFNDVDLNKVTPSIKNLNLGGIVNGGLNLHQKEGVYYPSSSIKVENFELNDIGYGLLDLNITGNKSLTSYNVDASLSGNGIDYMTALGKINVGKKPSIDIDVILNQFDIAVLNPYGKNVVSDIRGNASGYAKLSGSYVEPNISGELDLEDAGLRIPYLNVNMAMADHTKVDLEKQAFNFNHVDFEDTKYHTKAQLDGAIKHHNFRDWSLDLNLKAPERLLVLDTDYTEDALYYGTAFISGNASVKGPFDELVIDVDATSQKGTVFKIPLSDTESIGSNDYIYFLTEKDKKAIKAGKEVVFKRLKGLELNFDLDVTDDAEVEIVVDKKNGSTLKGRGAGTLLMEINTNGKFNMWGDFVVYKGTYDFKYAGLINKQFEVEPGGSITWDGSPTRANLNVRALYKTYANPAPVLENPTINRSIPVNVYIDLKGLLNNVDVNFDLEYPNLSSIVKAELEYRINDRENLELQALSLITQGSFYSEFVPGSNAHPENLLFERAAGIFDDLLVSEEDKFKVGLNYTKGNRSPDQDIADRVGVTLSTNISDKILINGRVGVPVGGLTKSVVVGNVEMEILLNDEGSLRAKVFNRESDIQYIGEELGYTQGVGISYSVDFDTFKELIQKILNKKITVSELREEAKKDGKESIIPKYINFPGQ